MGSYYAPFRPNQFPFCMGRANMSGLCTIRSFLVIDSCLARHWHWRSICRALGWGRGVEDVHPPLPAALIETETNQKQLHNASLYLATCDCASLKHNEMFAFHTSITSQMANKWIVLASHVPQVISASSVSTQAHLRAAQPRFNHQNHPLHE